MIIERGLQQIQRNLYETLRRIRPKVIHDLSPRWQGQSLAGRASRFRVPLWAVATEIHLVAAVDDLLARRAAYLLRRDGCERCESVSLCVTVPAVATSIVA